MLNKPAFIVEDYSHIYASAHVEFFFVFGENDMLDISVLVFIPTSFDYDTFIDIQIVCIGYDMHGKDFWCSLHNAIQDSQTR